MWLIDISRDFLSVISDGWSIILGWLNSTLLDVVKIASPIPFVGTVMAWLVDLVPIPIDGVYYTLGDFTVLQLMFGIGLPLFLAFTFVKWILNLIT